jgi:transposase
MGRPARAYNRGMRPKGTPQELANRRRLAVTRVREGYSPAEVARFLGVHVRSVYRWLADARDYGDRAGLNPKLHLGPKPRLDIEQELDVLIWLEYPASRHGFPTDGWTAPRIAAMIERHFGVRYHPRYVNQWLRERGVTPQKPLLKAREQDPDEVRRWLAQDWEQLRRQAERDGATLLFLDEAGLFLEPLLRRSQAPRGCPPEFEVPWAHRQKVSAIAALAWFPVAGGFGLLSRTLPEGYFASAEVADFVRWLLGQLEGPVILVWDGGPMHKGGPIRQLLKEFQGRLTIKRQPAYTPEVNPVEQLWGWLKYGRLANFFPRNVWHLDLRVSAELEAVAQDEHLLESFFRGTILPLPENMTLSA